MVGRILPLLTAIVFVATVPATAQRLTTVETAMIQAVDGENSQAVDLLERLVNINSGTLNAAGVLRVRDVVIPQIESLGFRSRWASMESIARAGDLVAEHPCAAGTGRCGKRLLLIGHLDTVFEPSSNFQKFSLVAGSNGTVASGPGVYDMKGGLVVMLSALKAMKAAGVLDGTEMTIVLSGDEERPGQPSSISRQDLIEAGKRSDIALEFESTTRIAGKDTLRVARRSSTSWKLETTGLTGHSSQVFSSTLGFGAINEMTRILDAFREQVPENGVTFNVGLLLGGTTLEVNDTNSGGSASGKTNVIPPAAVATGDLRTLNNEQTERAKAKMKAIVAAHLAQTGATLTFEEGYPAMAETEASRALARQLNEVNVSAGWPTVDVADPMSGGAGDIAFVASFVPGLVGVGAVGSGAHSDSEIVYLESLPLQAKRMALLMYRLTRH